jgi:glycosyltransferase involved in cell wall biosynthesis
MANTSRAKTSFSVVIPLHNKGPHIERALSSALRQTVPAHEIIVIDDASTDDGPARVQRHADSRIALLHRDTPGPGGYAARNLGIIQAQSPWIAFLDADDEWEPDHLERIADALAEQDPGVVAIGTAFNARYSDQNVQLDVLSRTAPLSGITRYDTDQFLQLWLDLQESPVWTSAIVANREALISVGLFPDGRCRRGGDKDLWLRLGLHGDVLLIPDVTATYHKDSVNMVTNIRSVNQPHCLCATVNSAIDQVPQRTRDLLLDIRNIETYKYALRTLKHERLERSQWRDFVPQRHPFRGLLLWVASTRLGYSLVSVGLRLTGRRKQ